MAPSSQAHLGPLPAFCPVPYPPNPPFHSDKQGASGNVTHIRGSKIPCAPLEKSHILSLLKWTNETPGTKSPGVLVSAGDKQDYHKL
jgi:hypothetical protein